MATLHKTYSSKSGARKAAKRAGVENELINIVEHNDGGVVRYGWKMTTPVEPETVVVEPAPAKQKKEPVVRVKQNGVTQPAFGGVCRQVWDWLDEHPAATAKEVREAAPDMSWNVNNASCEYYAWRKFHGVSGRVVKQGDSYRTATPEESAEEGDCLFRPVVSTSSCPLKHVDRSIVFQIAFSPSFLAQVFRYIAMRVAQVVL